MVAPKLKVTTGDWVLHAARHFPTLFPFQSNFARTKPHCHWGSLHNGRILFPQSVGLTLRVKVRPQWEWLLWLRTYNWKTMKKPTQSQSSFSCHCALTVVYKVIAKIHVLWGPTIPTAVLLTSYHSGSKSISRCPFCSFVFGLHLDVFRVFSPESGFPLSDCCLFMGAVRISLSCLGAHSSSLHKKTSLHHAAHLLLSEVIPPSEHP